MRTLFRLQKTDAQSKQGCLRSSLCILFLLPPFISSALGQKPLEPTPIVGSSGVQREVFDAEKNPALKAVGKINIIGRQWCTVILVAEDVGVTAGHCFLKTNYKFDLKKDFEPFWTTVIFRPNGFERIEDLSVKQVITAKSTPDYAFVRFNKKIPADVIKPLKITKLTLDEMRADESRLGCAGYNGDKELGSGGMLLTLSRNVKIVGNPRWKNRVDTNCFSTYGGSGGLFFRETTNAETKTGEYDFIGVIWGMTDEKLNAKGRLEKTTDIVTSITPVSVFYDELRAVIDKK